MKIGIVVFDDFTDLDLFLPWDLLNRVRIMFAENIDWQVKIIGTSDFHVSKSGLKIPMDESIDYVSQLDAVIFASGPGIHRLLSDQQYLSRLTLDPKRQLIAGLCSGALMLGALGLLVGQRATTYPTSMHRLKEFGAIPMRQRFIRNGNIATSAACLSAQDIVYWIVETLKDKSTAESIIRSIQPFDSDATVV